MDDTVSKKRVFVYNLVWITAFVITSLLTFWLLSVINSAESESLMVQLRAGDGSVFFTIAGLLIFALILSTGVALLFAFVFRFRWIEPRCFTDYSKFRWIWWGVLAGIPNGFLLRWRQQADTPFEAAFATTGSFIGFFVILGITFWLVFRVFIYSKPR